MKIPFSIWFSFDLKNCSKLKSPFVGIVGIVDWNPKLDMFFKCFDSGEIFIYRHLRNSRHNKSIDLKTFNLIRLSIFNFDAIGRKCDLVCFECFSTLLITVHYFRMYVWADGRKTNSNAIIKFRSCVFCTNRMTPSIWCVFVKDCAQIISPINKLTPFYSLIKGIIEIFSKPTWKFVCAFKTFKYNSKVGWPM